MVLFVLDQVAALVEDVERKTLKPKIVVAAVVEEEGVQESPLEQEESD